MHLRLFHNLYQAQNHRIGLVKPRVGPLSGSQESSGIYALRLPLGNSAHGVTLPQISRSAPGSAGPSAKPSKGCVLRQPVAGVYITRRVTGPQRPALCDEAEKSARVTAACHRTRGVTVLYLSTVDRAHKTARRPAAPALHLHIGEAVLHRPAVQAARKAAQAEAVRDAAVLPADSGHPGSLRRQMGHGRFGVDGSGRRPCDLVRLYFTAKKRDILEQGFIGDRGRQPSSVAAALRRNRTQMDFAPLPGRRFHGHRARRPAQQTACRHGAVRRFHFNVRQIDLARQKQRSRGGKTPRQPGHRGILVHSIGNRHDAAVGEIPHRLVRGRTDVDVLHISHDPAVIAHRVLARAAGFIGQQAAVFHGHRAESQGIAVGYAGFVEGTHQEPAHIGEASAAVLHL